MTPATQWPTPVGTPMSTPTAVQTPISRLSFGFSDDSNFLGGRPQQLAQPSPTGSFGFPRRLDVATVRAAGPTGSMSMRLQTISDASPIKMISPTGRRLSQDASLNASGYTLGVSDLDLSMEATQDMVTPSPDHDKRQNMLKKNEMSPSPVELPKGGLFGPDSPNEKPYTICKSEPFRMTPHSDDPILKSVRGPLRTTQMQNMTKAMTQ